MSQCSESAAEEWNRFLTVGEGTVSTPHIEDIVYGKELDDAEKAKLKGLV